MSQIFWQDARVKFIPLDFLRPVDELIEAMKPLCYEVTHAFFASYVHESDFSKLINCNVPLFTNFLTAVDIVAAGKLQRVCLHTGGKVCETSSGANRIRDLTGFHSTTAPILGRPRRRFMKRCRDTKITERTFTTSKRILCLISLVNVLGLGMLSGLMPSLALHRQVRSSHFTPP